MEWEGREGRCGEGRIAFGEPHRRLVGITPEHRREPNRRWGVVLRTPMVATRGAMVCKGHAPECLGPPCHPVVCDACATVGPTPHDGVRGSSTLGSARCRWCVRHPQARACHRPMVCEATAPWAPSLADGVRGYRTLGSFPSRWCARHPHPGLLP
ncbi:hypothetical protein V6N12_010058 [Hibiscus sabdariffa]|uniref:Uncharacterized protein n=1 Tax=Hibiscus sabdariffa TaxID=183260 RepID=A0ABR2ED03_9ROSI